MHVFLFVSSVLALEITSLPEILVTARKIEEPISNAPQLVTVFSETQIDKLQIEGLSDLSFLTPSLEFIDIGHSIESPLLLRGVGTYGAGEPSVGYFFDGVYLMAESFKAQELFDMERIEILKGSQNILYGKSTIGGLINVIPKEPNFQHEGKFSYEYSEHGKEKINAMLSGPIVSDTLAGRLAVFTEDFGGYYKNIQRNAMDNNRARSARLSFLALPNDTMEITPSIQIHHQEQGAFPYRKVGDDQDYDGQPFANNDVNEAETDWINSSLKISAQWDDIDFVSLTAWNKNNEDYGVDADYGSIPMSYMQREIEQEGYSQELRLNNQVDMTMKWLAGLYYYHLDDDVNTVGLFGGKQGIPVSIFTSLTRSSTYSVFGQLTKDLFDSVSITGGLRYDIDTRDQSGPGIDKDKKFYHLTPAVTMTYRPLPDTSLYGSWTTGHKPGGFNDGPFPDFDEEQSVSWELGFKHHQSKTLHLNGALFLTELDDQQLYEIDPVFLTDFTLNKGEARIRGVELEVIAQLNDHWSMRAELSWLNAKYTDYQAIRSGPSGVRLYDFDDNNLPHVPEYQGLLTVSYTSGVRDILGYYARFFGDLAIKANGVKYWDDFNESKQRPIQVVNLKVGLETDRFRIRVFADNLFDEDYFANYVEGYTFPLAGGSALAVRAGERRAGIDISVSF